MDVLYHYVGGARVAGTSGRFGPVYNASTGEEAASVPLASADEAREAVATATRAFAAWANETPVNRARAMFRFKALIERDMDKIADALSREHGKVISDAKGSITRGLEVVEFACGIPHLTKGNSRTVSAAASTCIRCASRSVSVSALRRSTFPPWCRSGCSRSRSPAATASS